MIAAGSSSRPAQTLSALIALSCPSSPVDTGSAPTGNETTQHDATKPRTADGGAEANTGASTSTGRSSNSTSSTDAGFRSTSVVPSSATQTTSLDGIPSDTTLPSASNTAPASVESGTNATSSAATDTVPNPDVTALLSEFAAYLDFEAVSDGAVYDARAVVSLNLDGALLEAGPSGQHVVFTASGSSASSTQLEFDTSASLSISAWVKLGALGDFNTFVGVDGTQVSALFLGMATPLASVKRRRLENSSVYSTRN